MEGDMDAVNSWMKTAPDENEYFIAFERYRYLTKIRCNIALGSYESAYSLVEAMNYYAAHCDRKYISMELGILAAIIRFRSGAEWEDGFVSVLEKICEYRFIPIISEEGGAVYELLRLCESRCAGNKRIDKKWFERVLSETGRVARRYPMYLKTEQKPPLSFSLQISVSLHALQTDYRYRRLPKSLASTTRLSAQG